MSSVIKNDLILYVNDKRKLLVFLVFSFFCGMNIDIAIGAHMSLMEYVIFLITNHYYLIYFMFMAYLFFSIVIMQEESELLYIRLGTIKKQYVCRLINVLLQTIFYVGCHLVIAFIIGFTKLECSNLFKASSIDGYYNDTLNFLMEYKKYFLNPGEALVATSLYMILGLTFLSMMIYVIKRVLGKKATMIAIGLIMVDLMMGFKCSFRGVAGFLFLNRYFILHHTLFSDGIPFVWINIMMVCLLLWCGYQILKNKKGNKIEMRRSGILDGMQRGMVVFSSILLGVYILLSCSVVLQKKEVISKSDLLFSVLLGYSSQSFYLIEFIQYVIFFGIPIFFVGMILEQEKNRYNQQIAIRYGSRTQWEKQLKRGINKYIAKYFYIYFFLLFGLTIVGCLFFQPVLSDYEMDFIQYTGITQKKFYAILFMAIVIKGIELVYYKSLFELLEQLLRNRIVSYFLAFAGFIVGVALDNDTFISYGASSLYNLANRISGTHFWDATVGIVVVLLVKIVVMKAISVMFKKVKWFAKVV